MSHAKRWFELECRHCGQRFIEMVGLLFHSCPGRGDAVNAKQKGNRNEHRTRRIFETAGDAVTRLIGGKGL